MKQIIGYQLSYFKELDKRILLLSILFIGIAIFINYNYNIEKEIRELNEIEQYVSWAFIFLMAFSFPYLLQRIFNNSNIFKSKGFIALLLIAPAIFAWKMSGNVHMDISPNEIENKYWNQVIYWPLKLTVVTIALLIIWRQSGYNKNFYGLSLSGLQIKPYVIMLLLMGPLVAIAATQKDFLAIYPKLQNVSFLSGTNNAWHVLLYELSYGSDFFTIELFFRGFLILAFAKWVGKDAILPMALFYCTIHFGKPVAECISSFFGGLILGVVTYHTQTIYGGLIVHLGIAWLMEIAGILAS